MSFYSGDSVILTFNDESIVNKEGYDIFFNLYETSNIHADVSVSYDEKSYEYLGRLNTDQMQNKFDLQSISYTHPSKL